MSRSSASWKSSGACDIPENFPVGLRVLVVDDDPTCLVILERMLKQCNYEAIICNRAEIALSLLREKNDVCDIVLSDVHMPDMDGFKLLELIGLEMDIPVIMMSVDDNKDVMMKGIAHGALDYIIKPVRIEALRAIWQHVFRKKQKREHFKGLTSADDVYQHHKVPEDVEDTSSGNEGRNWRNIKRKEYEDEYEERDETSSSKKPRVVWSIELHQKFVAAVNQLGLDRAVPKKILELMNVPGITRENIASHLQKYRLYLKRLSESKRPASIGTSFMGCTLDRGYDHRALVGRGQFSGQSLTPLQTSVLDRLNNSRSSVPLPRIDQRNTFNFGNPRFYGNPTNMAPNQLMGLNQSYQYPFNDVNSHVLMPMVGPGQGLSQSQPIFPNGMLGHGLGSNVSGGGIVPSYNLLNGSNQNRPDSGSPNMVFTNWSSYSSSKQMGPTSSFAVNDVSGTHHNGTGDNQDDILSALLDQPEGGIAQLEDELEFDDGYAFDDLPKAS